MDRTCTRCGKQHLGAFRMLELNNTTNEYQEPGTVSAGESQGLFPFGKTCYWRALALYRFRQAREANPEAFEYIEGRGWRNKGGRVFVKGGRV